MTLRLSLQPARRDLARPVANAQNRWAAREARILGLETDSGLRGLGELSPLPGFSRDTLDDCERALAALDLRHLPDRCTSGAAALSALGRASGALPNSLPAARAALESALLDLWSRAAGLPAWAFLSGSSALPKPRRVAALLMGEPEQALEQAQAARDRGLTTFKFKIGRPGAFARELEAVRRLRSELGSEAALRLDVNRAWTSDRVTDQLRELTDFAPEFVEEPCTTTDLADLPKSGVPLALDESLAEIGLENAAPEAFQAWGIRALILKPTLLGGVSACCAWAQIAARCGAQTLLSHTFEGPLGLALSATLALSIGSEPAAHGLDPEGARLEQLRLPFFSESRIVAWSSPGLGELEIFP